VASNPQNPRLPQRPRRALNNGAPGGSALDRALPHSLDAERALLGSMLLDESAIGEAISVLKDAGGDAFFLDRHRRFYNHVISLYDGSRPIDGVVIKEELVRRGEFEDLGGFDFLSDLIGAVPSALHARHYAEVVREKYLLRDLIGAAHRVLETAFDDAQPAAEILDFAEGEIFHVTERRVTNDAQALPDLVADVFRALESRDEAALTGEPSGFLELDELTCGFQPAELIIIAGRPSMGKTACGLNIAEHMSIAAGRPVLFFSLEMSRQQVAHRILCSWARVDSHKLRRGRLSSEDLARLHEAADHISGKPLFVDDTSGLTILELRARARMAYRKHAIRAIFVDYLQLMRAPGAESRQIEVAEISRGLKALAKELNIPVIAMAQLNRNSEDRSGNRPRMSDLRESGAIEQDADVVILLHRESYYKPADAVSPDEENTAELIVAKQRNGPIGDIKLHFNRQWTRFDNHIPSSAFAENLAVTRFG
jgi:replicative DNA helicase